MGNTSKIILAVFILTLSFLTLDSASNAAYWGVAGSFGTGNFHFTSKPYLFPEREASGNIEKIGVALVIESYPARDESFNTRLSFNLEKANLNSDEFIGSESLNCFNTDIALGVGLVTLPAFRIWLGPELRLGLANGSGDDFTKDTFARVVGFGALLGTNIHLGDNLDISLAAGARNEIYKSGSQFGADTTLEGNASYAYFMITLLFRIADDTDIVK
jgi:hypothetical protein